MAWLAKILGSCTFLSTCVELVDMLSMLWLTQHLPAVSQQWLVVGNEQGICVTFMNHLFDEIIQSVIGCIQNRLLIRLIIYGCI